MAYYKKSYKVGNTRVTTTRNSKTGKSNTTYSSSVNVGSTRYTNSRSSSGRTTSTVTKNMGNGYAYIDRKTTSTKSSKQPKYKSRRSRRKSSKSNSSIWILLLGVIILLLAHH